MQEILLFVAVGLLAVVAVLGAIAVVRLGTLSGSRDAALVELRTRLELLSEKGEALDRDVKQQLSLARQEQGTAAHAARTELGAALGAHTQTMTQHLGAMANAQNDALKHFGDRIAQLTHASEQRLEAVRATVEQRLDVLRADNAARLEAMRATVDEKLQVTLEQRLGQTFKQVSDRLDQVHKGLGEMQTLAAGVGDLKKVLTNVKSRGGWGEVQLGSLLAEILTPAQYAQNVATRPESRERVEYAVKFPGGGEDGTPCWLPIDCKFPLDGYERLQDAIERADVAAVEASRKALETYFKAEARAIRDKYVEPPHTTDFAILFVPTEGLYAEAVSRPGLADSLQRDCRVMLAGPMNLAAMLNSLQLGFRTLAIEKRSTEVWRVLAAVKTEFAKFGQILAKTKDRLDDVGRTLDDASRKSTTIARKLRDVEALPEAEAERLLTGDAPAVIDVEPEPPVDLLTPRAAD